MKINNVITNVQQDKWRVKSVPLSYSAALNQLIPVGKIRCLVACLSNGNGEQKRVLSVFTA